MPHGEPPPGDQTGKNAVTGAFRSCSAHCAGIVAMHMESGRSVNRSGLAIMPIRRKEVVGGWLLCWRSVVILGMSLSTFTVVHVVLSLVGIASGVLVLLRPSASPKAWGLTTLFLFTTLAASVTGLLYVLV